MNLGWSGGEKGEGGREGVELSKRRKESASLPRERRRELTLSCRLFISLGIDLHNNRPVPTRFHGERSPRPQDEDDLRSNGIEDDAGHVVFGGVPFLEGHSVPYR